MATHQGRLTLARLKPRAAEQRANEAV